ncbi:type II secretion system protein GspG [Candidatus Uabimicrobium amorphum]|uniref:Type II secretion system protein GspG n=1 Tax=Uabimicrobium amorphum TaxID=2596890 RepID=A0A5S9IK32_UABAM|nr:type II secretion system protein GspG [Candidatus Uabimicrobium amorphum]BBM83154.1 type II secretion system protein GspG [Candidatus Uabimicrobium amorphum]
MKDRPSRGGIACKYIFFIAFVVTLFAFVAIGVYDQRRAAQRSLVTTQLQTFSFALKYYKHINGNYPNEDQGLDLLLKKNQPLYNEQIPLMDPWGNKYLYKTTVTGYQLICYGRDGKKGGQGQDEDIIITD